MPENNERIIALEADLAEMHDWAGAVNAVLQKWYPREFYEQIAARAALRADRPAGGPVGK